MRSADVGLVVALADRDDVRHVADAGVEGIFHTAEVRRERIQHRVRILLDAGLGQLRRVRHLRDRLRADEGRDLHLRHTGLEQSVDQVELLLKGQHLLEVLPTVARTAFQNIDLVCHDRFLLTLCFCNTVSLNKISLINLRQNLVNRYLYFALFLKIVNQESQKRRNISNSSISGGDYSSFRHNFA